MSSCDTCGAGLSPAHESSYCSRECMPAEERAETAERERDEAQARLRELSTDVAKAVILMDFNPLLHDSASLESQALRVVAERDELQGQVAVMRRELLVIWGMLRLRDGRLSEPQYVECLDDIDVVLDSDAGKPAAEVIAAAKIVAEAPRQFRVQDGNYIVEGEQLDALCVAVKRLEGKTDGREDTGSPQGVDSTSPEDEG